MKSSTYRSLGLHRSVAHRNTPRKLWPKISSASSRRHEVLSSRLHHALDGIKTLVLDCDGVLWRGGDIIPGIRDALLHFRQLGLRLLFLTNNSSKSRKAYQAKFLDMNLQVDVEEIIPSSFCAAAYLKSVQFEGRVLLVGGNGVADELQEAGIDFKHCSNRTEGWNLEDFRKMPIDVEVKAVVVAFDEAFSYEALCRASSHIRELPDCMLIATNLDAYDDMGDGRMMPGTGTIVAAIEQATDRQAINVGKGGGWLLPYLLGEYSLKPEESCIVGDRLDTDIYLGKEGGLRTILPLTGVTDVADLAVLSESRMPDFVIQSLAELARSARQ